MMETDALFSAFKISFGGLLWGTLIQFLLGLLDRHGNTIVSNSRREYRKN